MSTERDYSESARSTVPGGGRLIVTNLGKRYGDVQAVKDIHFKLGNGVHGLLGPNGAGKSTLMRMLTTISDPTTGEIHWEGTRLRNEPRALRRVLGYLPQDFGVYPDLTLVEFLRYIAALRGVPRRTRDNRIDEMIQLTNLTDVRDRKLRTFSGGMRQRVGIAQALVNDPELLIVDEPTVGLDPQERVRFRNVLSEVGTDRVVILSTHIVPDIEATATTVALMNNGELVAHTDPETLAGRVEGDVYECTVPREQLPKLREAYLISQTVQRADGAQVRVVAEESPTSDARVVTPTLEDAYLACIEGDWALNETKRA